jgi:hypothetical protein
MPVETQKESDLPHISPSDMMPVLKADAESKRRGQNQGNRANLTSSTYFKELKGISNPGLDSNR